MKSFHSWILRKNILKSNLCKLGILSLTNGITAVLCKYTLLSQTGLRGRFKLIKNVSSEVFQIISLIRLFPFSTYIFSYTLYHPILV